MRHHPIIALVPFRSPGQGKTRLTDAGFTVEERARLSAAMLEDVAAALRGARVDRLVVAASGDDAAEAAVRLGFDVLGDPPGSRSLDDVVASAVVRLGRPHSLLVVMADLPRLRPSDVDRVLAADAAVVLAPTGDGGTGALLRTPSDVIPTAYGRASASRHEQLANAAGVRIEVVRSPGYEQDVDTIEDLHRLDRGTVGAATGEVLADLLADRPGG